MGNDRDKFHCYGKCNDSNNDTCLGKENSDDIVHLGVHSFHAVPLLIQECKESGLPLLPRSVSILGRFELLRALRHWNLCRYLAIHRSKEEKLSLVIQCHVQSLASKNVAFSQDQLWCYFHQALLALDFLHSRGVIHRNISPENVQLDNSGTIQLCNYGMFYMTMQGADVAFPIGKPQFLPPEVFLRSPNVYTKSSNDARQDTWMLAAVFVEILLRKDEENGWLGITQPLKVVGLLLDQLSMEANISMVDWPPLAKRIANSSVSLRWQSLLRRCLQLNVTCRPSAKQLLAEVELWTDCPTAPLPIYAQSTLSEVTFCPAATVAMPGPKWANLKKGLPPSSQFSSNKSPLAFRSPEEIHHWWCLAGGDAVRDSEHRITPAVLSLPCLAGVEGSVRRGGGALQPRPHLFRDVNKFLNITELLERASKINTDLFHPLLSERETQEEDGDGMSQQPIVIKERDLVYQMRRCVLFDRLITGFPYLRTQLWKEARVDVAPLRRAEVWAALLHVESDGSLLQSHYDSIDKESVGAADAQIAIDLPRCHQYEPRLASSAGHAALRRVLKAWVTKNSHRYVYWQGVDSLLAPFLLLNLAGEALAFACLERIIDKYLLNMFKSDNMKVLEEYMKVYMYLVAFHEPRLAAHLYALNLQPTQYALPWFFTLFSHKFPLEETVRLWDSLLLGNSSFPLCIAVAIWQQLREEHDALVLDQTECWALIKDLPVLDIGRLIQDAIRVFRTTPKSVTYRRKSSPSGEVQPTPPKLAADLFQLSRVPHITLDDFCELTTGAPSTHKLVVLDMRRKEDWARASFPNSVPLSDSWASLSDSADNTDSPLIGATEQIVASATSVPNLSLTVRQRSMVKVVLAADCESAVRAANALLGAGVSRVCCIHGGVSTLRDAGLLDVAVITS